MKEGKHKPAGLFYIAGLLAVLVFFSACDLPPGGYWEYDFSNQTSYYIELSLNKPYRTSTEGSETSTSFYLYPKTTQTVYVESDSLGFQWTSGTYSEENRKIYPEKSGSKVTFKERKE
jgi:hypothetical protein